MLCEGIGLSVCPIIPVNIVLACVKIPRDLLQQSSPAAKGQTGLIRILHESCLEKRGNIYTPKSVKKVGHARRNTYHSTIQIVVAYKRDPFQGYRSGPSNSRFAAWLPD